MLGMFSDTDIKVVMNNSTTTNKKLTNKGKYGWAYFFSSNCQTSDYFYVGWSYDYNNKDVFGKNYYEEKWTFEISHLIDGDFYVEKELTLDCIMNGSTPDDWIIKPNTPVLEYQWLYTVPTDDLYYLTEERFATKEEAKRKMKCYAEGIKIIKRIKRTVKTREVKEC